MGKNAVIRQLVCFIDASICLLAAFSLLACTSMQAIDAANPEQLRSSLHVGDKVEVNTTDGKLYKLEIVGMQPDGFTGKNDRGSGKILYRHIRSIERREFSSTKTTFLAAG